MDQKKEEKTINLEWSHEIKDKAIAAYAFIRRQLITKSPFYAVLSMRLQPRIATPLQVLTGCWCAATNGKHFIINPDGWLCLNPRQQVWVMKHEILHCVLRHPTRISTRNGAIWNLACFIGETKVLMADGSSKPIMDIWPGEYVASPHGPSRVLGVVDSGVREIVELSVNSSGQLFCTKDHRFFTQKGLLHAEQITDPVQGWLFKGSSEDPVRSGASQDDEYEGAFRSHEGFVRGRFGTSSSPWVSSQAGKAESQACEPGAVVLLDPYTMGVFGGFGGRGGYDYDQKEQEVLPVSCYSEQHFVSSVRVLEENRLLGHNHQEQSGSSVLEAVYFGLSDGRVVAWDAAFLGYQEETCGAIAAFHRHTEAAGNARSTDARYVGNLAENQGAERAWLQVREGAGRAKTYDLITEHHVYYAEGVLVHNCDYVVNMVLTKKKEDLPVEGALWDERFQKMDADSIYQILKTELTQECEAGDVKGDGGSDGQDSQQGNQGSGKDQGSGKGRGTGKGSGQGQGSGKGKGTGDQGSGQDQGGGGKGQQNKQRQAEEFKKLAERLGASPHSTMMDPFDDPETGESANPEDIENMKTQIENAWKAAFAQAAQMAAGKGDYPAGIDQLVERENTPRLPWERLLQQWVQARIREGYDWMRPNRRFVAEGIYLPGRGKPSLGDVVVIVDTSGSVSDKLLSAFLGEIEGVLKAHPARVFLVACDASAVLVGEYENAHDFPMEVPIVGRGGTDFTFGVKWIENHSGSFCEGEQYMDEIPRIAIYLTDGMGTYPQELPEGLDMLWVLSQNYEKGSPWYPPVGEAIIAFQDLD